MQKKRFFEKDKPYHVLSRAVEGRDIFEEERDCYRFIFQMYAANVGRPTPNLWRKNVTRAAKDLLEGNRVPSELVIIEHPPLVYILSFVLVGNHYHFKLVPGLENGIPKYMQRLNAGFAKYFNLKNDRSGTLFSRRYGAVPIETEFQMSAVRRYINVINSLDICEKGWRKKGLRDWEKAFERIKTYPFSSLPDLLGIRKSNILAPDRILKQYFGEQLSENKAEYAKFVEDYLKQNLADHDLLFLE